MGSLRIIKKDIDFLVSEVISDCWVFMYINPDKKTDDAIAVINDAVALRNDLYNRVNAHPTENVKKHYKAVTMDLLKGVDELFVRVSKLTK